MKRVVYFILAIISLNLQAFGNIVVIKDLKSPGELKILLVDKAADIDSLRIEGNLYGEDFDVINQMGCLWNLRFLDLSDSQIENKKIPDYALCGDLYRRFCNNIKKIILPDNVTDFGKLSFAFSNIEEINFPKNLVNLGIGSFSNSYRLGDEIVLPDRIEEIPIQTFQHCGNLKSVVLPKCLKKINLAAFLDCPNLHYVKFPKTLKEIGASAFQSCEIYEIIIPDSVKKIGMDGFGANVSCERLVIGSGLEVKESVCFQSLVNLTTLDIKCNVPITWSEDDFSSCDKLNKVSFCEGCESIAINILDKISNLEEVNLPATITTLREGAFYNIKNLKRIVCYAERVPNALNGDVNGNTDYSLEYSAFGGTTPKDAIIYVPESSINKYKNNPAWSYFHDFRPLSELADVCEIEEELSSETMYFDMQGRRLAEEPEKGMYIVKSGNVTKKVLK